MHSLKYLRFLTLGCKDVKIRKSEFMAKAYYSFHLFLVSKQLFSLAKIKFKGSVREKLKGV